MAKTKTEKYAIVEFEDSLSNISTTWLSSDLKNSKWPRYTSSNRYYKATKNMKVPDSTWEEHRIIKIYATCSDYTVARQKLKLTEQLSDNSYTDKEETVKKKVSKN